MVTVVFDVTSTSSPMSRSIVSHSCGLSGGVLRSLGLVSRTSEMLWSGGLVLSKAFTDSDGPLLTMRGSILCKNNNQKLALTQRNKKNYGFNNLYGHILVKSLILTFPPF